MLVFISTFCWRTFLYFIKKKIEFESKCFCFVLFCLGAEKRVAPVTYIPPELPDNIDELFMDAPHSGLNFDKYDDIPVQVTGKDPVNPIKSFEEAGILEQCSANIKKAKFTKPTPIQKYAIPVALKGRDLMACAQTGSGKTVCTQQQTTSNFVS